MQKGGKAEGKGKKGDSKGWNDSKGWTVGKGWSEGKGWNTSGKGWEQQRPALERDSKQYDVLVMENRTSPPQVVLRRPVQAEDLPWTPKVDRPGNEPQLYKQKILEDTEHLDANENAASLPEAEGRVF